jgi:sugar O-acyltransferase (sialic acid O-acetyltransferase NeuD family)
MELKRLLLIGGGGHCKSCIDVIEQTGQYEIVGIIDLPEKMGQSILGYPFIGTDEQLLAFKNKTDYYFIPLGQIGLPRRRKEIYDMLKANFCSLATIISPLAYVSIHAAVGEGTIIMHQAMVNADAVIGYNCIINTKALVEHDALIGNHCHISTGAILNGGVHLGADSFYGSSAISKEYIHIPEASFIKANSIVK